MTAHTHTQKCPICTYLDVWLQISDTSRVSLQISDSSRPCMPCSAGKYSNESSALSCRACPANATSPTGSSTVTNCTCNAGSSGPDGGTCTRCVSGKYSAPLGSAVLPSYSASGGPKGHTRLVYCKCVVMHGTVRGGGSTAEDAPPRFSPLISGESM